MSSLNSHSQRINSKTWHLFCDTGSRQNNYPQPTFFSPSQFSRKICPKTCSSSPPLDNLGQWSKIDLFGPSPHGSATPSHQRVGRRERYLRWPRLANRCGIGDGRGTAIVLYYTCSYQDRLYKVCSRWLLVTLVLTLLHSSL